MAIQNDSISFVTFGMFIIDEIEWQTPNPPAPKINLIGGAGTYAVLGARLAASPSQTLSRTISWIVDIGSDFPAEVKSTIDSWNTDCVFRYDSQRLTTRAWNGYGANDLRAFKYLTPKVRLEVSSLNPDQIMARSFHMVCSPDRCIDIITQLREARATTDPTKNDPVIVWEPIPDLCSPEQLSRLQEAASMCTVISPNHDELRMFFPDEMSKTETQSQLVMRLMGWDTEKSQASPPSSFSSGFSTAPIVIIREGSNGSTAYIHPNLPSTSQLRSQSTPISVHLPAYHTQAMSSCVTDPTGGGNTYLGALAIALGLSTTNNSTKLPLHTILSQYLSTNTNTTPTHNPSPSPNYNSQSPTHNINKDSIILKTTHAMIIALIAASFAIEQNGTPHLTSSHNPTPSTSPGNDLSSNPQPLHVSIMESTSDDTKSENETELWNGEKVIERTAKYLEREGEGIRREVQTAMNTIIAMAEAKVDQ